MKNIYSSGPSSELLKTFCAVAEIGNVTQAADVMSKTQSAVSIKIRQLEEQLSVSLFRRMARGVELTEEGFRLLPIAKKVLMEIDRAGQLFTDPLIGQIRVGIPDDYNETVLEQALAQFCTRHSEVEVFIQSGCTAGYADAINRGELDLAIYSGVPGKVAGSFLIEPTVWVSGQEFFVEEHDPLPLAIFDRNCRWRSVPTDSLDKANINWRIAYLTENFASYKAAIRSGLALGIMCESAVEPAARIIGESEGLPALPKTSRAILKNKNAEPNILAEMEKAILAAVLD